MNREYAHFHIVISVPIKLTNSLWTEPYTMSNISFKLLLAFLSLNLTALMAFEIEVSGNVGAEFRWFPNEGTINSMPRESFSISFKPELYSSWDNGKQSVLFVPFFRYDDQDSRRSHADIRELSYIYASTDWELRTGFRKVFWGVAESNHLVDIINQSDAVENSDLEDKLGQPMVNLALIQDWGTIDLFVLPGFRERTYSGKHGRFQPSFRFDKSAVEYQSAAKDKHVDYAIRYSTYIDIIDFGVYHFWGTTREPRFKSNVSESGQVALAPVYDLIHQSGLDLQATVENWLFKFEFLRRQGQGSTYMAGVGGFEYTIVGVFESALDLGLLSEYHWDERGETSSSPFNNDLFLGGRLAFNDSSDSQILAGVLSDLNNDGYFFNIEASRRFGSYWKAEVEFRLLVDTAKMSPLYSFRHDDVLQVELLRYF